jgi:hypothetical protein
MFAPGTILYFTPFYFENGSPPNFPLDTYVYGEQVDTMNYSLLTEIYKVENKDYIKLGRLSENEFNALRECLIKSSKVKRKIKKLLSKII